MLKIRLRRMGKTHAPFYRVVVSDSRRTPTASAVEEVGHYNPRPTPPEVNIDLPRVRYWVDQGALLSPTVKKLVQRAEKPAPADAQPAAEKKGAEKKGADKKGAEKKDAAPKAAEKKDAAPKAAPAAEEAPAAAAAPATEEAPAPEAASEAAPETASTESEPSA